MANRAFSCANATHGFKAKRGKALLIWDSCGPHKTAAVLAVLAEWGIKEMKLPVNNMTGLLQVMDLVGNGPLKAGIRRTRISNIFNYFQTWKISHLQVNLFPEPPRRIDSHLIAIDSH